MNSLLGPQHDNDTFGKYGKISVCHGNQSARVAATANIYEYMTLTDESYLARCVFGRRLENNPKIICQTISPTSK